MKRNYLPHSCLCNKSVITVSQVDHIISLTNMSQQCPILLLNCVSKSTVADFSFAVMMKLVEKTTTFTFYFFFSCLIELNVTVCK